MDTATKISLIALDHLYEQSELDLSHRFEVIGVVHDAPKWRVVCRAIPSTGDIHVSIVDGVVLSVEKTSRCMDLHSG